MARVLAKEDKAARGTHLDECSILVQEQKRYQELCGRNISQAPAAISRRENQAAAMAAAADVEGNLMFSEQELRAMPLKQLHDLKRGWLAVGQVAFANGAQWQAVFTKDGKGSGPPNAQGKCGVLKEDYIADLLAAIRSYSELMQECELASDGRDNVTWHATRPRDIWGGRDNVT